MYEYAHRGEFPINLPVEIRFVKSSTMLMSNAYDTDPDAIYCMIEILSANNTPGFNEFSNKVAKFWMDNFQARYIITHNGEKDTGIQSEHTSKSEIFNHF